MLSVVVRRRFRRLLRINRRASTQTRTRKPAAPAIMPIRVVLFI